MKVVTDPKGVLVNGKRYPQGTPVDQIEGATTSHLKIWSRFMQIADVPEPGASTAAAPQEQTAAPAEEAAAPAPTRGGRK